jgi:hypothetical protein
VSTSTVLLTAACVEAARISGRQVAAMTPLVNNLLNRRLDGADPLCCFNDQRPVEAVTPVGEVPDESEIRSALALTEIVPQTGLGELNCGFCVHVTGEPDLLRVMVTADSRHVAPRDLETFLRGMETLVVGGV